jgi:hypothetical protein
MQVTAGELALSGDKLLARSWIGSVQVLILLEQGLSDDMSSKSRSP